MAVNAYLTIRGQRLGLIRGSVVLPGREDQMKVLAVSHEVISPRDPVSGLPTGRRLHKPLVVTKELDRATPLLWSVLAANENLTEVVLRFWYRQPAPSTIEVQHYTVKLTNASISGIIQRMPTTQDPAWATDETYEEISFTYQRIDWTWTNGAITATDTWAL